MASEGISTTQPNETQNQSGETGRDFSRREENFGRFREHVQSTMGNDAKDFLEKFDEFEDKYINSRDRDRSHEATVVKDERGKVKEINAEYMDHALESYLVQFLEAEKSLQNEQVGNERLRGTSKAIKVAAKGLGGVLLTLGSFTGITGAATPFTLSAGIRLMTDAVGEAVQYWGLGKKVKGEKAVLNALRDQKGQNLASIMSALEARQLITKTGEAEDNTIRVDEIIETPEGEIHLNEMLQGIIDSLEIQGKDTSQLISNLGKVRRNGRLIRMIVNNAVTLGTVGAIMSGDGISLGMQNFDGGDPHQIKAYSDGVQFMYNSAGEVVEASKEGILHTISHAVGDGTVFGHQLAGDVPFWATYYGVGMQIFAPLLAGTAMEVADMAKQSSIANEKRKSPIFTLRGRTEAGNRHNELSGEERANSESITEDSASTLEAIKEQLTPGSVWEWTDGIGKKIVEIISSENGETKFYYLDANGDRESGEKIYGYSGEEHIRNGKKMANSVDEFKENRSVDEGVRTIAKDYGVKIPQVGDKWKPRKGLQGDPHLKPEGIFVEMIDGDIVLEAGDTIEVKRIGEKTKNVNISIRNSKGEYKRENITVSTESLLKNCIAKSSGVLVTTEAGEAVIEEMEENQHAEKLKLINQALKGRRIVSQLEKDQIYLINKKWYVIDGIDEEAGNIRAYVGSLVDGKIPEDKTLQSDRSNFVTIKFEDFLKAINTTSNEVLFKNKIAQQKEKPDKPEGGGGGGGRGGRGGGGAATA